MNKILLYLKDIKIYFRQHQVKVFFGLALLLGGVLHGYNLFHYPYFESDEGTYIVQAYSVREQSELTPYLYWYDHPPLGWFTIAAAVNLLQGDWNFFGNSLYTGRALMWLVHMFQIGLVFFLAQRFTRSPFLAFLTVVLFTTSPLAVYFQRRVLLDNLMTLWVLCSVAVLQLSTVRLRHVLMSGVFFGLALTTKITAVMFAPAIIYLIIVARWRIQAGFRLLGWCVTSGAIFSLWFIYAAIKTELIPAEDGSRVSLIGTILYQASRGTGKSFWEAGSSFRDNLFNWMILDSTYVFIFAIGLLVALFITVFSKEFRWLGLATILYFVFIIRGGIVIGFYVLPLIPFIALSIVVGIHLAYNKIKPNVAIPKLGYLMTGLILVSSIVCIYHYQPKVTKYLTVDETSNQIEALNWIKENLPADAKIITDIYGLTELKNPEYYNDKSFVNAEWYFKVARDPAVRFDKYRDDWRNFDYVFISHEMLYQSSIAELPIVKDAIRNSEPVMRWDKNANSFIDIQNFLTTNGDWAALYKINNNSRTQLLYAWNYFRDNFIVSYGQVVDPQLGVTTSEGQSYAMLRAALMNDHDSFDGLWAWTQHHMQHRLNDELISWLWKDGAQVDSANAADADVDIALALIFASQRFNEPRYLEDAKTIIADIWRQDVVQINGRYYLLPMEKSLARRDNYYLLNPSYFSPAHYRVFAEVDSERREEWLQLAEDTYDVLGADLPPNWLLVNDSTGELSSASQYIQQANVDNFGYDAFRTLWRVALDYSWYKTPAAEQYLASTGKLFEADWKNQGSFADSYAQNGERLTANYNPAVASGIMMAINTSASPQLSSEVYNRLFLDSLVLNEEKEIAYWSDPENYYELNWMWFGSALYNDNFPNLWQTYNN